MSKATEAISVIIAYKKEELKQLEKQLASIQEELDALKQLHSSLVEHKGG